MRTICRLKGEQAQTERDHDQREMAKPRDDEAHCKADEPGDGCGHDQAADRFAPAEFGDQPRRIGADAEESCVPQRDDARITEDDVKGEGEQRGDGDLARQRQIVWKEHEGQKRGQPESNLKRMPSAPRLQIGLGCNSRGSGDHD